MGDRPRIDTSAVIGEIIVDEHAYIENKGSKNARKIVEKSEQVYIEVWYDKHYISRKQFGNNDGSKRDGIEEEVIQHLVSDSLCHLIHYSFVVKGFAFINKKDQNDRTLRVVLQRETKNGLLNIAVGFHHIDNNRYEVTVFTAMVEDAFRISDGQYVLTLDGATSELKKMDNRKLVGIDEYP